MTACPRPSTSFLAACPFPGCTHRLDERGLTRNHVERHLRADGPAAVADALVAVHAHHVRVVRLGVAGDEMDRSPLSKSLIEALAGSPDATSKLGRLAAAVGAREHNVYTALTRLIDLGVVGRVSKGYYRLLTEPARGAS